MKQYFYVLAVFFASLLTAAAALQAVIYVIHGGEMFGLKSFKEWFTVTNALYLLSSLLVLKYYQHKNYRIAFLTATIHIIASLFLFIVFYYMIVERAVNRLYIPAVFLSLTAGISYALSLIFSQARERVWLKIAGIAILIFGLAQLTDALLYLNTESGLVKGNLDKIRPWLSLIGSFVPVLFILNFIEESRNSNKDRTPLQHLPYDNKTAGNFNIN